MDETEVIVRLLNQLSIKLSVLDKRVANLEQTTGDMGKIKPDNFQPRPDLISIESRLENLERAVIRNSSTGHQLAEYVTGIIGLKETITTKHQGLKYIWASMFLLGIGATVFFLYDTANEYLGEPTLTKVTLESRPNYTFPPFVLCNDAWFDTEKALSMGLSLNALKYSLGYWKYDGQLSFDSSDANGSRLEFLDFYQRHNFSGILAYYKAIAVDLTPLWSIEALYNSTTPAYLLKPGHEPMKLLFLPFFAICYEFKLNPVDGRLSFLMDPERVVVKFSDRTAGILKSVTENWFIHLTNDARSLYTWPTMIPNGVNVMMTIKQQLFVAWNRSEAPCISTEMDKKYHAPVCMANCAQELAAKEVIGCQQLITSSGDQPRHPSDYCNAFDTWRNRSPRDAEEISQYWTRLKEICCHRCPVKCDRTLYEAVLEGEDRVWNAFQADKDHSNMSVTTISIHHNAVYQGGVLTTKEVRSYTFTALVNNVGGTLGLFVGGTVMTFVQIILYFVNYLLERQDAANRLKEIECSDKATTRSSK